MEDKHKSQVGLSDLYYAKVLEDSASAYTADTPAWLAPVGTATLKPKTANDPQYADDQVADVAISEAESDLEIEVTNVPIDVAAALTGKEFDAATGRVIDTDGVPDYYAIGFKSKKMNDSYRFYWLLKVMFSPSEESFKTQGEKKEPQMVKLVAKVIKTVYKWTVNAKLVSVKRVFGDEDTTNFNGATWFNQVQTPSTSSPSALALSSSSPADEASGVSKTAAKTLTFNNALQDDAVDGVALLDDADAPVTCTVTLDATRKIITVTPASALDGSTAHMIVANVKDLYGQTLSAVVNFTTAA